MGSQINYFFSQRDEKIKEFKDILNPERVENSFSKTEETYNTNILRFVFKTIGQELKSDPVDKKGNLIAVLNHNDVAYRFINPKTIDVDTEFGVIIGVNKKSSKAFVLFQKGRNLFVYGEDQNNLDVTSPNEKSLTKAQFESFIGSSEDVVIQAFGQLPFEVKNVMDLVKFTFHSSNSDLINVLFTTLVISVVNLLIPIFTSSVYGQIVPTSDFGYFFVLIIIIIPISLTLFIASFIRARLFAKLKNSVDYRVQAAIINRVLRQPLEFIQKYTVSDFVSRISGITEIVQALSNTTLTALIGMVFGSISFIMMFYYQRNLSILIFAVYLLFTLLFIKTGKRQKQLQERVLASSIRSLDATTLLMSAVPQIRSSATESFFLTRWAKNIRYEADTSFKRQNLSDGLEILANTAYQSSMFILMVLVAYDFYRFSNGNMGFSYTGLFPYKPSVAGSFLAFTAAFSTFNLYYESFVLAVTDSVIGTIAQWSLSSPIIFQNPEEGYKPGLKSLVPKGNIEFNNIIFDTPKGDTVLDHLKLEIKSGQYIGITGPSGSGKSTFIRLVSSVYQPTAGEILIDGIPLNELDLKIYRESLGIVTQNTTMPATSIRDFVAPQASFSEEEIWEALKIACIAEAPGGFIQSLLHLSDKQSFQA